MCDMCVCVCGGGGLCVVMGFEGGGGALYVCLHTCL